jgi:hypothetical protein
MGILFIAFSGRQTPAMMAVDANTDICLKRYPEQTGGVP